jgi:hypothetical protein
VGKATESVIICCVLGMACGAFGVAAGQARELEDPCVSDWVMAQRGEAKDGGKHFGVLPEVAFRERGYAYRAGVLVADGPEVDSLTLLVFRGREGEIRRIYAEDLPTLAPSLTRLVAELTETCLVPAMPPWFAVTVDDLDADGKHEIIVESNVSGGCRDCLSEVRVYQVKGATAVKVVEETYHRLIFGRGRGLFLQSFTRGPGGEIIPSVKNFFATPAR